MHVNSRRWLLLGTKIVGTIGFIATCLTGVVLAAEDTLFGPYSLTVDRTADYITDPINASGYGSLFLNFDYNAQELEAGESFTYGWRGDSDHDFGTIEGMTNEVAEEVGSISLSLPAEAAVSGLVIYFKVTAGSSGTYDYVEISNLIITGESEIVDDDGDTVPNNIDLCFDTKADELTNWGRSQGRYRWGGEAWEATERGALKFMPDMEYTYGCSVTQILDGLYEATGKYYGGHYKHGISKSVLEFWHAQAF